MVWSCFCRWTRAERHTCPLQVTVVSPAGYVTTIIEDAKIYATHAKKSSVDADDIKLAIQCRMDQSFTSPPPRDVSLHRPGGTRTLGSAGLPQTTEAV